MKPFLLLASRPEDEAADDEYAGFLEAGDLAPHELIRVRLEAAPMPAIDFGDYSGIIVGGSPYNVSDRPEDKSAAQRRVELELGTLIDRIVAEDFPFLGACYGIGLLTDRLHGLVDGTFAEEAGPTAVSLTPAGAADQIFGGLAETFEAFVGHKEACTELPPGAVALATGPRCPVQAFRVGRNVYATQFHPELTNASIMMRLRIYRDNGYVNPEALDEVFAAIGAASVTEPANLMRAFARHFATDAPAAREG